ncbi:hypothetical protein RB595_004281 [Gaeumannomyces hyphopodioides]
MGGGGSKETGGGSVPSPFPLTNFQDKLLQPPDDDSVRQTWIILRSAIDAHARRFYHCDRVCQSRELVRESLRAAGVVADAQEAEDLSTLLHSPRHRRLGLRICIARVMVASIDLCGHPDDTSLEPAVVELLRKFESLRPAAAAAAATGGEEQQQQPTPGKEEEAALAAWRMITAFFLQPAAQEPRAGRQPCVDVLERVLLVFARRPDDDKDARLAGLVCVAGRAIELGEKIFCHAARWRFEWKPPPEELEERLAEEGSRRSIVVFPALLRSDEEGTKERGGLKYIIIKRKAVSAGSFFDVPVPVRQMQDSSSSSSSGSDSETPDEAPVRGRRRRSRRN